MHSYDRQAEILQLLAQSGYASVHKLAQTLHVSEPTMRRDLRDTAAQRCSSAARIYRFRCAVKSILKKNA